MGPSNNSFVKLITLVALLFLLSTPYFTLSISASHGQFCNGSTNQSCDTSSALLTCQDFSCQCILADSMVFLPLPTKISFGDYDNNDLQGGSGRCVSLVDEPCGAMSLSELNEVAIDCVNNAFCNSQGECQCHSNYFKSGDGFCIQQGGFGEGCNISRNSQECSTSLGLSCVNGKCQCNSTLSIDSLKFFDDDSDDGGRHLRRCLARPGQSCRDDGHQTCVPHAVCKEEHGVDVGIMVENGINSRMKVKHICVCEPGFENSKKKKVCVGSYNMTCDTQSNRFCRKDLSCIKGQCGCKHPADQIYDKDTQSCKSLVGGPCSNSGACVTNAICKRFNNGENRDNQLGKGDNDGPINYHEYCECGDGFVENINRTCDVAFGHPCSQTLDGWKCDVLAGLICRDGFCGCPDPSQTFDKDSMTCRGLAGSYCYRHVKDQCIANSHCKPHRNGFLPFGHCVCNEDYEMQMDKTCT